jgi:hypothetical protein
MRLIFHGPFHGGSLQNTHFYIISFTLSRCRCQLPRGRTGVPRQVYHLGRLILERP